MHRRPFLPTGSGQDLFLTEQQKDQYGMFSKFSLISYGNLAKSIRTFLAYFFSAVKQNLMFLSNEHYLTFSPVSVILRQFSRLVID